MTDNPRLTLMTAQTTAEVLEALARREWWQAHEKDEAKRDACPPDAIPTEDELRDWLSERLPYMHDEASRRLIALADAMRGPFMLDMSKDASPLPEKLPWWWTELWSAVEIEWRPDLPILLRSMFRIPSVPGPIAFVCDEDKGAFAYARFEEVHGTWRELESQHERLSHPFAPIVRAWQERALNGEADRKANTIMPTPFATVRDLRSEQGSLFGELPATDRAGLATIREPDLFGSLPGFEPAESAVVPSLPLVLFDATGEASAARGRGAPLALRVWVECVLWGKPGERSVPRRLVCTLREFINAVWPNGTFRQSRDGPKLLRALYRVHNARVPWTDPETGRPGGYWAAATVTNMPRLNDMNSSLVFEVSLPPGSGAGPMIHRPTLRKYGVMSAPAYRSSLGLAYLWNRHLTHNGKRLPPTVPTVERDTRGVVVDAQGQSLTGKGGRAVTHWSDDRAVRTGDYERNPELERLPWLTPEDLLALAFPEANLSTKQARSDALRRTREALRIMEKNGDLVIVEDGTRWHLEPPDWWGAPGGNETHKRRTL